MTREYNSTRSGAFLDYKGYRAWARRSGDGMIFDSDGAVVHRIVAFAMEDAQAKVEDYLRERVG